MAHGAMPWLLVPVGAAVITVDLLLATSLSLRATLVRFHLQRTFPGFLGLPGRPRVRSELPSALVDCRR
jgi:hypothetical protein